MAPGVIPYRPLDISKREICLLFIHPSHWSDDADWADDETSSEDSNLPEDEVGEDEMHDDVVRCTLYTVSPDDEPEYEALSYIWGDSSKRTGIITDGLCRMVTVNLQRALRRLRLVDEPRILWADAVCINQGDVEERGQQFGLMAVLYSSCYRCVVWRGEEEDFPLRPYDIGERDKDLHHRKKHDVDAFEKYLTDQQGTTKMQPIKRNIEFDSQAESWLDVEAGFIFAKMLAKDADRHMYDIPFYQTTALPNFRFCGDWQNAWCSLLNIIVERPWWRRTWTFQEDVLPER